MEANIIQIGDRGGIILPAEILREMNLSIRDAVKMRIVDRRIVIEASPRQGWADAARKAHAHGDDKLFFQDTLSEETVPEWTW